MAPEIKWKVAPYDIYGKRHRGLYEVYRLLLRPGGDGHYIVSRESKGPFRTKRKANGVARRLNRREV